LTNQVVQGDGMDENAQRRKLDILAFRMKLYSMFVSKWAVLASSIGIMVLAVILGIALIFSSGRSCLNIQSIVGYISMGIYPLALIITYMILFVDIFHRRVTLIQSFY